MSKDLEEMINEAPQLTLTPFDQTEGVTEGHALTEAVPVSEPVPVPELTPEEERLVSDFADKINLKDSNMVLQYGAGAQKKIADFSESALDNVKSKDLGEVGQMLTNVVTELKSFETEGEEKGFFGFFKKSANRLDT